MYHLHQQTLFSGGEHVHLAIPVWQIIVRSVVIYVVLLLGLRVFGKREVGQSTVFDLVLVLLVANAVQPAMTGPDSSLTGGSVIIAVPSDHKFLHSRHKVRYRKRA